MLPLVKEINGILDEKGTTGSDEFVNVKKEVDMQREKEKEIER